jgi:hypothetical protein
MINSGEGLVSSRGLPDIAQFFLALAIICFVIVLASGVCAFRDCIRDAIRRRGILGPRVRSMNPSRRGRKALKRIGIDSGKPLTEGSLRRLGIEDCERRRREMGGL